MRGVEAKLKQEAMRLRSEGPICPSRDPRSRALRGWLAKEDGEKVDDLVVPETPPHKAHALVHSFEDSLLHETIEPRVPLLQATQAATRRIPQRSGW